MPVIHIIGLVNGDPTPYDDTYLVEYDPSSPGVDPNGDPMTAYIVATKDIQKARRLKDAGEALELLRNARIAVAHHEN